jgi:hypothetical protein
LTRAAFFLYSLAMEQEWTESSYEDPPKSATPQTLADLLFPQCAASKRGELEEFRLEFEAIHGPTDLTKRYTSIWPTEQRHWLIKNDLKRFFDGLPPFAKAYLKGKMQLAARQGMLDEMPDRMLQLFVSGQMQLDHELRNH